MPNFDANNMLAQVATWQGADISLNDRFNGNLDAALANIQARCIIMPSRTDLYFPPEDSALEVMGMPNATLRVIESVWGHRAGGPGSDPADIACVEQAIFELLNI
jgi:homoserine O-acetyltransferase